MQYHRSNNNLNDSGATLLMTCVCACLQDLGKALLELKGHSNRRPTPAVPAPCACVSCECPRCEQRQACASCSCPACPALPRSPPQQRQGGLQEFAGHDQATQVQLDGTIKVHEFTATDRFELLDWESFDARHVFSAHRLVDKGRVNRKTVGATMMETDAAIEFARRALEGAGHQGMRFSSGQMRVHPVQGTEFMLDFGTKAEGTNKLSGPFERIELLRPLPDGFLITRIHGEKRNFSANLAIASASVDGAGGSRSSSSSSSRTSANKGVYMIMPLSGRIEQFRAFLDRLLKCCLQGSKSSPIMHLSVIYFGGKAESTEGGGGGAAGFAQAIAAIEAVLVNTAKIATSNFKYKVIAQERVDFSRGGGLEMGATKLAEDFTSGTIAEVNPLMFFVDVDMTVTTAFFRRCTY